MGLDFDLKKYTDLKNLNEAVQYPKEFKQPIDYHLISTLISSFDTDINEAIERHKNKIINDIIFQKYSFGYFGLTSLDGFEQRTGRLPPGDCCKSR